MRLVIPQELAAFCETHHIQRLMIFGSVLRDDFRPDSDIDVLVEFESGVKMGLFAFGGLQMELSELLGREVDLKTPDELSPRFQQKVLDSAQTLYRNTENPEL
ncbi:MAG: nucleotidyltransferase family protein [Anaerolineae bacterium]|nr:nucleotidyltransferase family protein [Anaerolineae bacterium]